MGDFPFLTTQVFQDIFFIELLSSYLKLIRVDTMKIMGLKIKFPRILPFERRKAERVRIHETLYLNYEASKDRVNGTAEGKDISTSGVRFASFSKFPPGTPLDLTLRFSPEYFQNKPLQVRAIVVRCYRLVRQRRYRIACKFENLDSSTKEEIQAYIVWLKEQKVKLAFLR